jgi:hypothetical protein
MAAVVRTGFLASERWGPGCLVHKLRFRMGGRQRVRYLGVNADLVATVRETLRELQRVRDAQRNLRRLASRARALLRGVKPRIADDPSVSVIASMDSACDEYEAVGRTVSSAACLSAASNGAIAAYKDPKSGANLGEVISAVKGFMSLPRLPV